MERTRELIQSANSENEYDKEWVVECYSSLANLYTAKGLWWSIFLDIPGETELALRCHLDCLRVEPNSASALVDGEQMLVDSFLRQPQPSQQSLENFRKLSRFLST